MQKILQKDGNMYKYETHLHTSEGSACAHSTGAEMARRYKELGYDGIFVTNHFFNGNTAVDRSLPWDQQIDAFMKGYENAKAEGEKIGLSVFFGWEYSYLSEGTDLLTYGLGADFLKAHPDLCKLSAKKYFDLIHASGGFIVHAHPFREAEYVTMIRLFFDRVDGVEVINATHADERFNDRAYAYAQSYGLPMTSGSDAHAADRIFGGGILTDKPITCAADYLDALKNGGIRALLRRHVPNDD